ncbi:L,D-transpeptidase [Crocosphaera chwakensis]|uniref:L,D-TPase catalytic domain-containing protein n=1 Tax=Crocosphaera chwakensis CCY0110 TaxID=391612 RepID=A3ILU0_9CHRO|nr:L,D-transpeptidase [Crocosphaera chwakensis]EAZ92396.1 hypothetical protein CY0110_01684 [Crocosphaera chwakensis CCY0110]
MKYKLTLALFTCLVMFAYVSHGKQKQGQSIEALETDNVVLRQENSFSHEQPEQLTPTLNPETTLESSTAPNFSPYSSPRETYPQTITTWEREPYIEPPQNNDDSGPYTNARMSQGNYMTLTPTQTKNALGNPIYELRLYANGQLIGTYQTVTGRANSQNRNRHQSGTEAPLPDGQYQVASAEVAGTHPEVGGRFLPIEPLFPTQRYALGIHYDPSYQKNNGEDGTEGCIALTNKPDLDQVLEYVYTYQPQYLDVKLQG